MSKYNNCNMGLFVRLKDTRLHLWRQCYETLVCLTFLCKFQRLHFSFLLQFTNTVYNYIFTNQTSHEYTQILRVYFLVICCSGSWLFCYSSLQIHYTTVVTNHSNTSFMFISLGFVRDYFVLYLIPINFCVPLIFVHPKILYFAPL